MVGEHGMNNEATTLNHRFSILFITWNFWKQKYTIHVLIFIQDSDNTILDLTNDKYLS